MLILERRTGSAIRVGTDIRIRVVSTPCKNRVRLGLEVPPGIPIWREDAVHSELRYDEHEIDNSLHVLHIEDDATHARLMQRALGHEPSIHMTHVESGEAGLRLLQDTPESARPQLVLLDLHLPGMSGIDCVRTIRAQPNLKTLSVVMLSFSDSDDLIEASLDAGANAFITKASSFDEMTRSMARIVDFWRHTQRVSSGPRSRETAHDVAIPC